MFKELHLDYYLRNPNNNYLFKSWYQRKEGKGRGNKKGITIKKKNAGRIAGRCIRFRILWLLLALFQMHSLFCFPKS